MTRIVPLTKELLAGALLEERDPLAMRQAQHPFWWDQFLAEGSVGGALIGGGRVLAAAGLIPQVPGRALAWLMLSPAADRRARVLALRHVRGVMDRRQADPAFRRIEMFVRAAEPWCGSFGRIMGFEREGLLRAWDELGRDYVLFARVRESG